MSSWSQISRNAENLFTGRQRMQQQEWDRERQHALDKHSIRMDLERNNRAARDHERSEELHQFQRQTAESNAQRSRTLAETESTEANLASHGRLAQITRQHLLNERTGQLDTSDPNKVGNWVHSVNSLTHMDQNLSRFVSGWVSKRTGNKYDDVEFEYLPEQGGVALRMRNSRTGAEGVHTERGSSDPDDPVTIIPVDEFNGIIDYMAHMTQAHIPQQVIELFLGGAKGEHPVDPLVTEADPRVVAETTARVVEEYPDAEPEEVVARVHAIMDSSDDADEAEDAADEVEDAADEPQPAIGRMSTMRDRLSTPSSQLGALGRANRFDSRNGVDIPETSVPSNFAEPPAAQPEPERRQLTSEERGARIGRAVADFVAPDENAIARHQAALERRAAGNERLSAAFGETRRFFQGMFSPSSVPEGGFPKKQAAEGDSNANVPAAPRPTEQQASDPAQASDYIRTNGDAIRNGDMRPNATHRAAAERTLSNPYDASHRDRGQTALYLYATRAATLEDALRFQATGYLDASAATLAAQTQGRERSDLIALHQANRAMIQRVADSHPDVVKSIRSGYETMLKDAGIKVGEAPNGLENDFHAYLSILVGRTLPAVAMNGMTASEAEAAERENIYRTLQSVANNPVIRSAFAESVPKAMAIASKDKRSPDVGILAISMAVANIRGLSDATLTSREKKAAATLFTDITKEYGGADSQTADPVSLNAAYAIVGALRDNGRSLDRISLEMVSDFMHLWPTALERSGGDIEEAASWMGTAVRNAAPHLR